MLDNLKLLAKRLITSRRHSGAGEGLSLWRLIRQGLPYYFNPRGFARPPLTLFIGINGRCNLRCRMCDVGQQNTESMFYQNLVGPDKADFPLERFKTLMDEVQAYRPYVGLTTTEPLLYPYIFDAVRYAGQKGLRMNISTNGVLVERFAEEIVDS
ncbi:MAG: radical SAM protein, partial [Pseudomonadota bacterium]